MADTVKKRKLLKGKHKDLIFYSLMMLFPIAQFCVFYIGVNFNSFSFSYTFYCTYFFFRFRISTF